MSELLNTKINTILRINKILMNILVIFVSVFALVYILIFITNDIGWSVFVWVFILAPLSLVFKILSVFSVIFGVTGWILSIKAKNEVLSNTLKRKSLILLSSVGILLIVKRIIF